PSEPRHHKDTTPPLPSRRCSTSPEQETRQMAGSPDTRERGEVRSRAGWRTWASARAEVGISPLTSTRVNGLPVLCPIKPSVLFKLVCPICLAGDCRQGCECHPFKGSRGVKHVRQPLPDVGTCIKDAERGFPDGRARALPACLC